MNPNQVSNGFVKPVPTEEEKGKVNLIITWSLFLANVEKSYKSDLRVFLLLL